MGPGPGEGERPPRSAPLRLPGQGSAGRRHRGRGERASAPQCPTVPQGPQVSPPPGRSPVVFDRPQAVRATSLGAAPALKLFLKLKQEKLTEELPEMLFFLPKRTAVLGW